MTEQDLFCAIGSVDDALLLESEQKQVRRLPKHFGLIAAVLALLLTACAAPVAIQAYNALKGSTVDFKKTGSIQAGTQKMDADFYDVTLEIEISPDAPDTIEALYLPEALAAYQKDLHLYEIRDDVIYITYNIHDNFSQILTFQQCTFDENTKIGETRISGAFISYLQTPPVVTTKQYEDMEVVDIVCEDMLVTDIDVSLGMGSHLLYWSDGMYLYAMSVPGDWTEEQISQMVTSMVPAEDLGKWLGGTNVISLDVQADASAPDTIEDAYLPTRLLDQGTITSWREDTDRLVVELTMKGPRDSVYGDVRYEQRTIPEGNPVVFREMYLTDNPEGSAKTYGDISTKVFTSAVHKSGRSDGTTEYSGGRHIYWSDGQYIYYLRLPTFLTPSAVEKIITSLTQVDNLSDYLPDPQ